MVVKMNPKIIDAIFAVLVFSIPFKYIPKIFWQSFLGGPFGSDLVFYPLAVGFIYTAYCQWKYGNVIYQWNKFKKFIIIYLLVLFISLVHGLANFPYYEQILNGPVTQIQRLPSVLALLSNVGIRLDEVTALKFWMLGRPIKGILFESLYTFGAGYMIFCWYHNRKKRAFELVRKTVIVNLIVIAGYGIIDVCYQNGQLWAQNILTAINPILHASPTLYSSYDAADWHPALYWDGQVRSIFLEPSYFGIYMAFAFPILVWAIFKENKIVYKIGLEILFFLLAFELFLGQSRTGVAISTGEAFILVVVCIYLHTRKFIDLLLSLVVVATFAFGSSLGFINYEQVPVTIGTPLATRWVEVHSEAEGSNAVLVKKVYADVDTKDYFGEAIGSLSNNGKTQKHEGSNHSRFTVIKTNIRIGEKHPVFGVGNGLHNAYLRDILSEDPGDEIQMWNRVMDKSGWMRGVFPNLGDWFVRFAETGVLGLLVFAFPLMTAICHLGFKVLNRKSLIGKANIDCIFILISLVGLAATGIGDSLNNMFCCWLMLSMAFLEIHGGEYRKVENKKISHGKEENI